MAKLKTVLSASRPWTLWNSLSAFTISSVPPTGKTTTCGVNSHCFWSSVAFGLSPFFGLGVLARRPRVFVPFLGLGAAGQPYHRVLHASSRAHLERLVGLARPAGLHVA